MADGLVPEEKYLEPGQRISQFISLAGRERLGNVQPLKLGPEIRRNPLRRKAIILLVTVKI